MGQAMAISTMFPTRRLQKVLLPVLGSFDIVLLRRGERRNLHTSRRMPVNFVLSPPQKRLE